MIARKPPLRLTCNFYALYEAFQVQAVRLNTAAHTGVFDAVPVGAAYKRANILRKIGALEHEIAESRTVQKRGKQMSRKIVLNSKI